VQIVDYTSKPQQWENEKLETPSYFLHNSFKEKTCDVALVKNTTSLGKVHCSLGKLASPPRKSFMRRRSLSYLKEQLQPFYLWGIIMEEGTYGGPWSNHVLKGERA
jgi:hypothetical protein